MVVEGEGLGKTYGQQIFEGERFEGTKKAKYIILMKVKNEVSVVWFAEVVLLLQPRRGTSEEEREPSKWSTCMRQYFPICLR